MELSLSLQLMQLASVFLAGLFLGAVYRLLSSIRLPTGKLADILCDGLFCCLFALALFILGMGPGRGELRLYMPLLLLGGMAFFFALFSAPLTPVCRALSRFIVKFALLRRALLRRVCKHYRKFAEYLKNVFSKGPRGFTITENGAWCKHLPGKHRRVYSEDKDLEAEKVKHIY